MNYSTFGVVVADVASVVAGVVASSFFGWEGPVWLIGTTLSVLAGKRGTRGAVMVKTPSEDNDDWTSLGLAPSGNWYLRVNCLEMELQEEGENN